MAKTTVMEKITNAISGTSKPDLSALEIENDGQVVAARQAESAAVKQAHDLEGGLGQLVSERARLDSEYTVAAGLPDEAQVREGRRKFIAADEQVRGRQDHIRRAQAAAVEARKAREQAEIEAEQRIKAKVYEALASITARIQKAVENELIPAFTEAEQVIDAADQIAGWGSPAARRNGWRLGLGDAGGRLFRARNLPFRGEAAIGAALLETPQGSAWTEFKKAARDLGLIE